MAAYAALTSLINSIHKIPQISPFKIQQIKSLTEHVTFLQEFLEGYESPAIHSDEADPLEMRIADAAYAAEDFVESHILDMIQLRRSVTTSREKIVNPQILSQDFVESLILDRVQLRRSVTTSREKTVNPQILPQLQRSTNTWSIPREETENGSTVNPQILPQLQRSTNTPVFSFSGYLMKSMNDGEKTGSPLSLEKVIEDMNSIKKDVMKMKKEKTRVVEAHTSASGGSSSISSFMVGLDDVILEVLDKLTGGDNNRQVIPIVGMGGIGKTTLIKTVFDHALVKDNFDICAWATISQQYNTREILCELLSQANKKSKDDLSYMSGGDLAVELHKYLSNRRYLIVLDDMWSIEAWENIQLSLPDNSNSSRIVVTTRLSNLGSQLDSSYCLKMKFLDEVSSWDLFSKSVFGEGSCPLELEEIGKGIVENCRGLPLSIVVVGGLLKKLEHTQQCWESIRKNSSSIVNSQNEDFCFKILKMSYNHLPVYLKPCFLYMGVFEEDRAIRVSTLVKLWVSEGFLKPANGKSLEMAAKEYLSDLVDRNLILVHELGSTGSIKYCKLHDLLRDCCWREAGKVGFYNVIGQYKFEGLNRQCIVIPGSTSDPYSLRPMSRARSFICDSAKALPLPFEESRLLRTLKAYDRDAYRSNDFKFDDLFKFVNLRYLAAGVHGLSTFPSSIGLWNLQTLIILHCSQVYLPDEIWKMRQLRHVEIHKGTLQLPNPPSSSGNIAIMQNLQTLKGVYNLDCKVVSKIIPNIKKLEVSGVVMTSNLNSLSKLESCRCRWWGISHVKNATFPYTLKKLSLGSDSFHWEVSASMLRTIAALPLLQKLKLERARFQPKHWKTSEDLFPSLKFLELKWCLLESWITESSHFPLLEKLHLFGIKELEEIPSEIGEIPTLQSILLEHCSKSVVESAKSIAEEQEELQVRVVLINDEDNNNNQELRSLAIPNFLVEIVDL